jgi:hypothetical protein
MLQIKKGGISWLHLFLYRQDLFTKSIQLRRVHKSTQNFVQITYILQFSDSSLRTYRIFL